MNDDANLMIRKAIVRWAPLLIWMFVIFVVSHQPSNTLPHYGRWDILVKKGGHLLAYALLAVFARWAGLNAWSSFILAVVFAASDELHQRYIVGRSGNFIDVFIDGTGALSAMLAMRRFPVHRRLSGWARTALSGEPMPRDV